MTSTAYKTKENSQVVPAGTVRETYVFGWYKFGEQRWGTDEDEFYHTGGTWSQSAYDQISYNESTLRLSSRIQYQVGPRYKSDGSQEWRHCIHTKFGLDPINVMEHSPFHIDYAGMASATGSKSKKYDVQSYPSTRTVYPEGRGPVDVRVWLLHNGYPIMPQTDYTQCPGPTTLEEAHNMTPGDLIATYYPDSIEDFGEYKAKQEDAFRKATDLNQLLHTESYFYTDLAQIVFPIGKLIAGKRAVQRMALLLSTLRSRFARRPVWEALKAAIRLDLIERFVVETTIADVQDYLKSFDDVWRVFEAAHGYNNREWSRIAHRPSPFDAISEVRRQEMSMYVPGPGGLPSSGIQGTQWTARSKQRWSPDPDEFIWYYPPNSGRAVGNNESDFTCVGSVYRDLNSAMFDEGFEGEKPIVVSSVGASIHLNYFRWAKVRYKHVSALSPLKVWANRVGITKPLMSLWDAIPLSFVCDYFFRMGDWIQGISEYIADFSELRGEIIDAGDPWASDRWEVGGYTTLANYKPDKVRAALEAKGYDLKGLSLPPKTASAATRSRYSRYPMNRWENLSRLRVLSDSDLNDTQKRTLVEIAFQKYDKRLVKLEQPALAAKAAVTQLKIDSKKWRTPNPVIDGMTADQFSEYVKRTLKQFSTTVKVAAARTR